MVISVKYIIKFKLRSTLCKNWKYFCIGQIKAKYMQLKPFMWLKKQIKFRYLDDMKNVCVFFLAIKVVCCENKKKTDS